MNVYSRSRGARRPSFSMNFVPPEREQGMPGACCTRGLVCNVCIRYAHEHTGTAGALRHSLRSGFTAYAALSLETNSFCLHHCRLDGSSIRLDQIRHRQLGTSHGCRDHTVLPYAATSIILRAVLHSRPKPPCERLLAPDAAASAASHPNVRDDGQRPSSSGRDGGFVGLISRAGTNEGSGD